MGRKNKKYIFQNQKKKIRMFHYKNACLIFYILITCSKRNVHKLTRHNRGIWLITIYIGSIGITT